MFQSIYNVPDWAPDGDSSFHICCIFEYDFEDVTGVFENHGAVKYGDLKSLVVYSGSVEPEAYDLFIMIDSVLRSNRLKET